MRRVHEKVKEVRMEKLLEKKLHGTFMRDKKEAADERKWLWLTMEVLRKKDKTCNICNTGVV